jgi:hypothetical protein
MPLLTVASFSHWISFYCWWLPAAENSLLLCIVFFSVFHSFLTPQTIKYLSLSASSHIKPVNASTTPNFCSPITSFWKEILLNVHLKHYQETPESHKFQLFKLLRQSDKLLAIASAKLPTNEIRYIFKNYGQNFFSLLYPRACSLNAFFFLVVSSFPFTSIHNFLRCVTGRTLWKLSEIRNVYKTIIDILKVKFSSLFLG